MDAAALIAHNDGMRRHDAESGLVRLEEWARSDRFGMYVPRYATVAPRGWTVAHVVTQCEYTERLESTFPEVVAIVRSTEGLCVAGGAAAWPILGSDVGDVDLFLYGLADAPPAARWAKVDEVAGKIRAAFADARYVMETMSEGLVTFHVERESASSPSADDRTLTIQLVLRAYHSMSSILHGFDVPACCVGFDGEETLMTALGASALLYRAMVVHPAYQSPSFAYRLAKYFRRGCALVLVHLRPDALERDVTLSLGGLRVTPRSVRGRLAIGDVEAGQETSDYAPEPRRRSRYPRRYAYPSRVFALAAANTVQLASAKRRFVIEGESARSEYGRRTRAALAFASYARAEPTFADVLPRAAFERVVDAAVRGAVANGRVNVRSLRRVLGLSEAEIAEISAAAASAFAAGALRVDAGAALAPFRAALVGRYDAAPATLAWWIVEDPSRQFSASRDPRPVSAREWYGAAFAERVEEPTKDETIDGLLARLGGAAPAASAYAEGTCALCLGDVVRGAANSMTLECGHTFHAAGAERGACLGLLAWLLRAERMTCPMCRHAVSAESAEPERGAFEIHVAW